MKSRSSIVNPVASTGKAHPDAEIGNTFLVGHPEAEQAEDFDVGVRSNVRSTQASAASDATSWSQITCPSTSNC